MLLTKDTWKAFLDPLDVVAIVKLSRATYRKMIQNFLWATGYNVVATPLATGTLFMPGRAAHSRHGSGAGVRGHGDRGR